MHSMLPAFSAAVVAVGGAVGNAAIKKKHRAEIAQHQQQHQQEIEEWKEEVENAREMLEDAKVQLETQKAHQDTTERALIAATERAEKATHRGRAAKLWKEEVEVLKKATEVISAEMKVLQEEKSRVEDSHKDSISVWKSQIVDIVDKHSHGIVSSQQMAGLLLTLVSDMESGKRTLDEDIKQLATTTSNASDSDFGTTMVTNVLSSTEHLVRLLKTAQSSSTSCEEPVSFEPRLQPPSVPQRHLKTPGKEERPALRAREVNPIISDMEKVVDSHVKRRGIAGVDSEGTLVFQKTPPVRKTRGRTVPKMVNNAGAKRHTTSLDSEGLSFPTIKEPDLDKLPSSKNEPSLLLIR
ncbi:hypothetical protein CYMTET_11345 [Cymbomonas tetramitiformis]|uniref:Uncharacterized protein n=1 Tax=Cymbomonas tetramitiformis TaxID=36881 RepID=A0AAE0GMR1_9CHLO|nr:hypothetical protein CYMTET_11345 [Cymbomonas tetramitiformis]